MHLNWGFVSFWFPPSHSSLDYTLLLLLLFFTFYHFGCVILCSYYIFYFGKYYNSCRIYNDRLGTTSNDSLLFIKVFCLNIYNMWWKKKNPLCPTLILVCFCYKLFRVGWFFFFFNLNWNNFWLYWKKFYTFYINKWLIRI